MFDAIKKVTDEARDKGDLCHTKAPEISKGNEKKVTDEARDKGDLCHTKAPEISKGNEKIDDFEDF